jgi:hypothetical protein
MITNHRESQRGRAQEAGETQDSPNKSSRVNVGTPVSSADIEATSKVAGCNVGELKVRRLVRSTIYTLLNPKIK